MLHKLDNYLGNVCYCRLLVAVANEIGANYNINCVMSHFQFQMPK